MTILRVTDQQLWTKNVFNIIIHIFYSGPSMQICMFHPYMDNFMMTSSNGNIFRGTGHLCGEFRWIPHTKASDAELWCVFFYVTVITEHKMQQGNIPFPFIVTCYGPFVLMYNHSSIQNIQTHTLTDTHTQLGSNFGQVRLGFFW